MKSFDTVLSALDVLKQNVAERDQAKADESVAVAEQQRVTASANQAIQDATAAREAAHKVTSTERAEVEAARLALHAAVDEAAAETEVVVDTDPTSAG